MKRLIILGLVILTMLIAILFNCIPPAEEKNNEETTKIVFFGGTDPKGDFMEVKLDKTNKKITVYNYTTNEKHGPYSYSQVTEKSINGGFSLIYKAMVNSGDISYALFAEFQDAALVYQLFDKNNKATGNPVYVVKRETIQKTQLYEKAYTWMKFLMDKDPLNNNIADKSDMEAGFVAFDSSSTQGLLYGAGYSRRADIFQYATNGISNINNNNPKTKLDDFIYDSNSNSFYFGGTNMEDRIYLTGTPSGTFVLDVGLNRGGGGGIGIPQAATKDLNSKYYGTYFVIMYEYMYNKDHSDDFSINPIKVVIGNDHILKAYKLSDNTETGAAFFSAFMRPISDLSADESPGGTQKIIDQFATVSENSNASSTIVKNAHKCYGTFISMLNNSVRTEIIATIFDPEGRFLGFTGFDSNDSDPTNDYILRFGFGIKDPNYSNSGL